MNKSKINDAIALTLDLDQFQLIDQNGLTYDILPDWRECLVAIYNDLEKVKDGASVAEQLPWNDNLYKKIILEISDTVKDLANRYEYIFLPEYDILNLPKDRVALSHLFITVLNIFCTELSKINLDATIYYNFNEINGDIYTCSKCFYRNECNIDDWYSRTNKYKTFRCRKCGYTANKYENIAGLLYRAGLDEFYHE